MGMIELGGLASAILALVTLTTKLIQLITAIQSLINRIDAMQEDLEAGLSQQVKISDQLVDHRHRLTLLEAV